MSRILIASLFAIGLLFTGCKTANTDRPHRGCQRVGSNRVSRNGSIHHHYAKPRVPAEETVK